MEAKLDQIITNTSPKTSFLVTLTGKGSKLEKTYGSNSKSKFNISSL